MTTADERLHTIWNGCMTNDRKSQEQLYRLLAPRMLAVCMRYATDKDEAQDILQEGFIKMFRNMKNYRGEGSLEGWIRRIMVHCAISRYRKLKPIVLVDDFAAEEAAAIPISSSFNDNGLEAKDLMKLVQKLPKTYRSVFNMYAIEGYSHQEIGLVAGHERTFITHYTAPCPYAFKRYGSETNHARRTLPGRISRSRY
ncbi:RNA polymerase sigma factor [Mucilaginibacter sp. P19]|uniref:RNA polymerase sigma factor n=1 Tax=Mucilaginibacter sp. P19 TaxID=3423947 RepID=UPI003D6745E5